MGRKTAIISDESLLAGTTTTKRKGVILYPHFLALTIWPELETIGEWLLNPFRIGEAEWKVLNSDIFPSWMDRTIMEIARREFAENGDTPECQKVMERMVFYLASKVYAISHTIPNYEVVLKKGSGPLSRRPRRRNRIWAIRKKTCRKRSSTAPFSLPSGESSTTPSGWARKQSSRPRKWRTADIRTAPRPPHHG